MISLAPFFSFCANHMQINLTLGSSQISLLSKQNSRNCTADRGISSPCEEAQLQAQQKRPYNELKLHQVDNGGGGLRAQPAHSSAPEQHCHHH